MELQIDKKLPLYALVIDDKDESGVDFIAMVDKPAIEKNWMAFQNQKMDFVITNQDRRIITGPLMIPNLPIYRRDEIGEYNVFFTAETINQICQKYFKNGYTSNVNMMHDPNQITKGIYMFESFIADKSRGVLCPTAYSGLPDGTWFGSFKVDNQDVWDSFVKTGVFKGFSVEGIFQHKYLVDKSQADTDALAKRILSLRKQLTGIKNIGKV